MQDTKGKLSADACAFVLADNLERAPQQACPGIHARQPESCVCGLPVVINPVSVIVDFDVQAVAMLLDADRRFVSVAVFPAIRQCFLADTEDCRPDLVRHIGVIAVGTGSDLHFEAERREMFNQFV